MNIFQKMGRCSSAVLVVIALAALPAQAQDYPTRPIRLVLAGSPGAFQDSIARLLAQAMSERLGQSVVAENRAAAAQQVAYEYVARSQPDGYTLLFGPSDLAMLPSMKKVLPYDAIKDFAPVALVASSWTTISVNPKLPYNTLAELIAYAKANPGKIRYGAMGLGSALQIAVEMLKLKTGVDMVHVPYKGGAPITTDTISGQIEVASLGLGSVVGRREQLRVLAQTGATRHPRLADVPTTAELGMPEVKMDTWFGVLAPANTPRAIVIRLAGVIGPILQQPAFQQRLFAIGCDTAWMPPEAFATFIAEELRRWAKILPAVGVLPED